jgi:hypothetical protein
MTATDDEFALAWQANRPRSAARLPTTATGFLTLSLTRSGPPRTTVYAVRVQAVIATLRRVLVMVS